MTVLGVGNEKQEAELILRSLNSGAWCICGSYGTWVKWLCVSGTSNSFCKMGQEFVLGWGGVWTCTAHQQIRYIPFIKDN